MSPKSHSSPHKRNEDKIELIFKSKRENVYTAGVSLDNRINYHPKNIKKSLFQSKLIRTYTQHLHILCIHGLYAHCVYTVLVAVDISPHKILFLFCHMFCIVFYFSILSLPFPHSILQYAILLSKFDAFFS